MKNLEYFYFENLFFTKKWEWNGDSCSCNTINTTDGSPRARDHRMYQNLQTVDQHSVYKKILPFEIKEIVYVMDLDLLTNLVLSTKPGPIPFSVI